MKLRSDGCFTTVVDGEAVILDSQQSVYLTVNTVGTVLLDLLQDGATSDELVDATLAHFDVDRASAERDVTSFVGQLRAQQLLDE